MCPSPRALMAFFNAVDSGCLSAAARRVCKSQAVAHLHIEFQCRWLG